MSSLQQTPAFAELQNAFKDQLELIKNKRTVVIKLANFPSGLTLGAICEALALLLQVYNPPVHLERIILSENDLTALPNEIQLICGNHLRYLDMHGNNFTTVPSILASCCPNLEGLDLSQNNLTLLSRSVFWSLEKLKILLLKDNKFAYLPPILGEMINLESIAVSGNPLKMPSLEVVQSMNGSVNDLKAYLLSNSATLDQQLRLQAQQAPQKPAPPTTPSIARTRSLSDTRSKSLKATRRMGLIINSKTTPENASVTANNPDATPSKPERKLLLPTNEKSEFPAIFSSKEPNISVESTIVPSTYTTTTASNSRSNSPSISSTQTSTLSRPGSRNRNRSNTYRDINQMLEHSELADSEHKSGAYFRRLSTLQERPADETFKQQNPDANVSHGEDNKPLSMAFLRNQMQEGSPMKPNTKKLATNQQVLQLQHMHQTSHSTSQIAVASSLSTSSQAPHDLGLILKVARKVLFSLSELHSSLKRFTGFCSDKKVSMKVVSLLHTSKGNIDSLVEAMEAVEDNGENQELILNSVNTCIASFKLILLILSENFGAFVAKIDVCFIRMIFLTLFGSFNELQNAYRLLNPSSTLVKSQAGLSRNQSSLGLSHMDTKAKMMNSNQPALEELPTPGLTNPTSALATEPAASLDEIDERLYQHIDLATKNAQVVFSELTKAISKSAIATANTKTPQPINNTVATKFKELTSVCMSSMDITKRLMAKLAALRLNQNASTRKLFWDDINLFLKAIIQTFSSVKAIMKDAPILNEVRQSMATLTKTTKELTIILEASSYKSITDVLGSPPHQPSAVSMPSSAILPPAGFQISSSAFNLPQLSASAAPVRTPLVATVGSVAAQAILPMQDGSHTATNSNFSLTPLNIPPLVSLDVLNTGLHTAPVQSMEQYYAKNVNPFDRL